MDERPPVGRLLDRMVGPLLKLGGRLLGRPEEEVLQDLTGRSRGGLESQPGVASLERARAALSAGRVGEALALFAESAAASPEDPWAWHGRGDALLASDDPQGALEAYEEAVKRAPTEGLSQLGRGNALERLGRSDEAVNALQEALVLDPGLDWARAGLERLRGLQAAEDD